MTTPALSCAAVNEAPPIELVETTIDDQIATTDPTLCNHSGYAAGQTWALSQSKQPPGFSLFINWWMSSQEPGADALQQAAAALLERPKLTEPEALNFWHSVASNLPPDNSPEAIGKFVDGFGWGLRHGFKALQVRRRKQHDQQRAEEAAHRQRMAGYAPHADLV